MFGLALHVDETAGAGARAWSTIWCETVVAAGINQVQETAGACARAWSTIWGETVVAAGVNQILEANRVETHVQVSSGLLETFLPVGLNLSKEIESTEFLHEFHVMFGLALHVDETAGAGARAWSTIWCETVVAAGINQVQEAAGAGARAWSTRWSETVVA